jgi:hypothetical protein
MAHLDHLTETEMAAYADGRLDAVERRRVASHIEACAECRAELVEVLNLAEEHAATPARKRRSAAPLRWLVPAALAAGLAGIVLYQRSATVADPDTTVRASELAPADAAPTIATVGPRDGDNLPPENRRFVWRAQRTDGYVFTLLAEDGSPLWRGETTDTTVILPDDVTLTPGLRYFWRVTAFVDGMTASTGPQRLQVSR